MAIIATFMTINLLHLTLLLLSEAIIHKLQNDTLKLIFFNKIYSFEKSTKTIPCNKIRDKNFKRNGLLLSQFVKVKYIFIQFSYTHKK